MEGRALGVPPIGRIALHTNKWSVTPAVIRQVTHANCYSQDVPIQADCYRQQHKLTVTADKCQQHKPTVTANITS